MAEDAEYVGEKCVKCGEVGEDRRTLYMACFYAMDELGLPLEQMKIKGEVFEFVGTEEVRFSSDPQFPAHTFPKFADTPSGTIERQFFTLRVCKSCRSSWMQSIKDWFNTPSKRASCGSGIYVRENGATVEITEEEWNRRLAAKGAVGLK